MEEKLFRFNYFIDNYNGSIFLNANNYELLDKYKNKVIIDCASSDDNIRNKISVCKDCILVINTLKSDKDLQNKFISLVKDRNYKSMSLPDTVKIVVLGDFEKVSKELISYCKIIK